MTRRTTRKTRDAREMIRRDMQHDPDFAQRVADEKLNFHVAQLIFDARTAANLTQKQLAELVGSSQPNIARLEDADYEGHSLSMLRRIADALGLRVELRLVPKVEGKRDR